MTSAQDRLTQLFEGLGHNRREILTPEGVKLLVEPANYGERLTAFVIDLVLWLGASLVILLSGSLLINLIHNLLKLPNFDIVLVVSVLLFITFLVRIFYFLYFELSWQGATPGKRLVGLRVIDRRGGPLLPSAVVARNLTREVEIFLPLGILWSVGGHGQAALEQLSIAGWLLIFAALPLINKDHMRGGDLIAGTMVIALPRRVLLGDLVEKSARYAFTDSQLGAYGAFELQVLEELLRRPDLTQSPRLLREVCDKICRKIEWAPSPPQSDTVVFLKDFYTAERAYLERAQLFGRPRLDKHHHGQRPTAAERP